jgi:hypothetical protein
MESELKPRSSPAGSTNNEGATKPPYLPSPCLTAPYTKRFDPELYSGLSYRRAVSRPSTCFCLWPDAILSQAVVILTREDAEISAGAMVADVPSAGMTLYQTDFAFLPV